YPATPSWMEGPSADLRRRLAGLRRNRVPSKVEEPVEILRLVGTVGERVGLLGSGLLYRRPVQPVSAPRLRAEDSGGPIPIANIGMAPHGEDRLGGGDAPVRAGRAADKVVVPVADDRGGPGTADEEVEAGVVVGQGVRALAADQDGVAGADGGQVRGSP